MKKIHQLYFLIAAGSIFFACSKPYQEALPTVQMVSVVPYGFADSVLVTGNVTSQGASAVQYVGFSFSNTPKFDLLSNQVIVNGGSGNFTAIVPMLNDSTYYFKCFAANQYGYNSSSAYKYTLPSAKPDSAPCSIPTNTVQFQGNNTPYGIYWGGSPPYGSFYAEADFGLSYALDIYFNKVPTNGIYTVLNTMDFVDNTSPYVATVLFSGTSFNEGGYVYITQNKDGSTTVSFCSLVVNLYSTNYTVSAKFTFN